MITDNRKIIELWYAGLGESYRSTRGPLATAGCHDSPKHRMIYYITVGSTMALMAIFCLIVAWVVREILWLAGMSVIVAFLTLPTAVSLFKAAHLLSRAVSSGSDPDLEDPVRMKTIRRAVKWGEGKGLIRGDPAGAWHFVDKKGR